MNSVNYITHFSTIRKSILDKVGGLDGSVNGAQDWDLFLRVTDVTKKIHHIPKMLYSWRVHDGSTAKSTDSKPYVVEAQKNTISNSLKRQGYSAFEVTEDPRHPGCWHTKIAVIGEPLVSIIIPSKDQFEVVRRCLDSIYKKTTYKNFEVIVVDTGSTDSKVRKLYEELSAKHKNFSTLDWGEQPFSYARSCNKGAKAASGELLLMLNNDTEVKTPDWIQLLAGDAQRKEVGAVGCRLFFPDGQTVQHAGIGVGMGGVAANSFSGVKLTDPLTLTQHLMLNTKHNMSAVTAACMMIRKEIFDEIGGFDEEFRVTYNDVDLCLKLVEKGYQNIYTPFVELIHHESISVGLPGESSKRDVSELSSAEELFKKRWAKYVEHDPALNPNLDKSKVLYVI